MGIGEEPHDMGFDAKCYNAIFGKHYPDSMFVSMGSSSEVEKAGKWARQLILALTSGVSLRTLLDRDDMNQREIEEARGKGISVLRRREIESYLFDEEIIRKLCRVTGNHEKEVEAWEIVQNCLRQVRAGSGVAADEVKAARGNIFARFKKLLSLHDAGKKSETFMIDSLAPLVTPDTKVYKEMEQSIWWDRKSRKDAYCASFLADIPITHPSLRARHFTSQTPDPHGPASTSSCSHG